MGSKDITSAIRGISIHFRILSQLIQDGASVCVACRMALQALCAFVLFVTYCSKC